MARVSPRGRGIADLALSNEKITDEIIKLAVQKQYFALLFVPKEKMSSELINLAVKKNKI